MDSVAPPPRGLVTPLVAHARRLAAKAKRVPIRATLNRHDSGTGADINVLIFGESWAGGRKYLPALPDTLSGMAGRRANVCQIGYSGANTRIQLARLARDFPGDAIKGIFPGQRIDFTVILTGVNDLTQRRGAKTYARDAAHLYSIFEKLSGEVRIFEIPPVNINPSLGLVSTVKRRINAAIKWETSPDVLLDYRQQLRESVPTEHIISYDQFLPTYEPHRMDGMGIHLLPSEFSELGKHIARVIHQKLIA